MANRWRLAQDWAKRINRALELGYMVCLCGIDDELMLQEQLIIKGQEILCKASEKSNYLLFENDPAYDHGLYETHKKWASRMDVKIYREVDQSEYFMKNLDNHNFR